MSRAVSAPTFAEAILNGIAKAQRDYEQWTSDEWLWRAPEYLATVYSAREIARSLKNRDAWFLTLENGASKAIESAGARGRGTLHRQMRPKGRIDLMIWWGNGTPRAPVEIKRYVTRPNQIKKDALRIQKMLHRSHGKTSIDFGMIAFYTSSQQKTATLAAETVERRLKTVHTATKMLVQHNTIATMRKRKTTKVNKAKSAWTVAVITFRRRGGIA